MVPKVKKFDHRAHVSFVRRISPVLTKPYLTGEPSPVSSASFTEGNEGHPSQAKHVGGTMIAKTYRVREMCNLMLVRHNIYLHTRVADSR